MIEWPIVQLAFVLDRLESGKRPRGGAVEAGIPSIGGEHVRPDGSVSSEVRTFVPPDFFRGLFKGVLRTGDILVVKDGATTGKTGIYIGCTGIDAAVNEHVFLIRCDESQCLQKFAFHVLRSPIGNRMVMSDFRGAAQGGISRDFASKVLFRLPPLDEQRRIVDMLDRAAEIRRRADAARTKARAIIPALFLDTFGDPIANPKGWAVTNLGEMITKGPQNGLYRPASEYGTGVRILRIDSFDSGRIIDQAALRRLRIDRDAAQRYGLLQDDIVINRVNSPPQLGKSAIVPALEEPTVFESNMMRFRINENSILPHLLRDCLQIETYRRVLIRNAKHAINQSSINQQDVKHVRVFLPPLPLQIDYVEQTKRVEAIALKLDAAAAKAESMAAALAAEVFDETAKFGKRMKAADPEYAAAD